MASPNPASDNCLQADEVVGLMSQAEVIQACRVYWNRETEVQAREAITKRLEKDLKCGVGRLSKMPLEKRAEMLAGQLRSIIYRQWAGRVLHFYSVGKEEPPSLDTIFSVMPTLESNDAQAPIPLPTLVDAAETLLKNYPQRRVLILLASLIALGKPTWQQLPAALDQIGVKLRTWLAESRDAQGDPRIAALTAEVESLKAQLAKQKEVLAQSEERFVAAQTAHRSEVALRSEEIENLKAEQEEAIQRRVELELSKELRPWLSGARELERMSARRTDRALAKRISEALAKLEALDMAYGSWKRCKRRLSRFEGYEAAIETALENCTRPTPELVELQAEIRAEVHKLRRLLRNPSESTGLCQRLHKSLSMAPDQSKLEEVQSLITPLCNNGLLTEKESRSLFKAAKRCYDRFASLSAPKQIETPYRTGWELDRKLRLNESAAVFIDGNNILLRLNEVYAETLDEGRIGSRARETLIQHLAKLAIRYSNVQFRIVFDDDTHDESRREPNLVIERSGGTGKDRADRVIGSHLAGLSRSLQGFVVTDDNSFRLETVQMGGIYVTSRLWHYLLCEHGVFPQFESVSDPDPGSA